MRRLFTGMICLVFFTGLLGIQAQEEPTPVDVQAEPIPEPTPLPPPPTFQPAVRDLLVRARTDLELVTTTRLGAGRPEGWNGSLDIDNPQLPLLIRLDLELLTAIVLGESTRPLDWFGAVPISISVIARDIRHDLELLADVVYTPGQRPPGWSGDDPLLRCGRAIQTLALMLGRDGLLTPTADPAAPDYCAQVELELVRYSENNLLNLPPDRTVFSAPALALQPGMVMIETNFAVAFLNRGATVSVGVIPPDTAVLPIARSYGQFSKMTLMQGENFLVFIDYRDSSLSDEAFNALPDVEAYTGEAPFCAAPWCSQ